MYKLQLSGCAWVLLGQCLVLLLPVLKLLQVPGVAGKETTGHTTTTLIAGRVAQEARMLLKHTNWSVSEIAESLGFTDVAHFCNFFKRQTTLTPGDFRA